jgi:hypothetical protein
VAEEISRDFSLVSAVSSRLHFGSVRPAVGEYRFASNSAATFSAMI